MTTKIENEVMVNLHSELNLHMYEILVLKSGYNIISILSDTLVYPSSEPVFYIYIFWASFQKTFHFWTCAILPEHK